MTSQTALAALLILALVSVLGHMLLPSLITKNLQTLVLALSVVGCTYVLARHAKNVV